MNEFMTNGGVDGAHNLRDLGGLEAGARRLRHGQLIRSGELAGLEAAGTASLLSLGLGRIVDFRSAVERDVAPTGTALLAAVPHWHMGRSESLGDPAPILRSCLISAEASRSVVHALYRHMPFAHHLAYRALIDTVLKGKPVLYHCAAGKDRTGVATALLLALLGVELEAIRADYALSEAAVETTIANFLTKAGSEVVRGTPPHIWRPLMASDPAYLDSMFEEINRLYGSMQRYAREVLGFGDDVGNRLRDVLLT